VLLLWEEHGEKLAAKNLEAFLYHYAPSPHRKIKKTKLILQRKPMFPKTNGSKQVIVK
jgi:hypothetical protein